MPTLCKRHHGIFHFHQIILPGECIILCYGASVLPKQFVGMGYTGWLATPFPAVVVAEILNFAMVPAIDHLLYMKDTVGSSMSTN